MNRLAHPVLASRSREWNHRLKGVRDDMFALTDEERMILETVKRIVKKEIAPRAAELDETVAFPEYARKVFAENGILNPLLPVEYGESRLRSSSVP